MNDLYKVFVRSWWKQGKPYCGRKTILATGLTYEQARDYCQTYNANHNPGKRGRKAEFSYQKRG